MSKSTLDRLATKYVGDPKSELVFVSDDHGVVAVFDGREFLDDAEALAKRLMPDPAWVEHRDGVYFDNAASARRQRYEDD